MTLARSARIKIDPARLLKSRWVHDTAHRFVCAAIASKINDGARVMRYRED